MPKGSGHVQNMIGRGGSRNRVFKWNLMMACTLMIKGGGITINNGIVKVSFRFEFYDIPEVERERRASFNDISIDQVYQTKYILSFS